MAKITPKQLIVTLIIVLLSGTTYVVNDKLVGGDQFSAEQIAFMIAEGNWYYCEVENNLKQCSELTKYAVENAKCIMLNGKGDICTKDGIRYSWNDFSDYIGVKLSDPFIESIQLKKVSFYNVSENIYVNCTKWTYNLSDCTTYIINLSGEVCINWSKIYYDGICSNGTKKFLKNVTTFESIGFNINYSDKTYTIIGYCCAFYNESPYKEFVGLPVISCKEIIVGVCNPLIQQSSKDEKVYDEFGRIYVIHKTHVEPKRVGGYDYVDNYGVKISQLEVKK